jgi:serine protease AprX
LLPLVLTLPFASPTSGGSVPHQDAALASGWMSAVPTAPTVATTLKDVRSIIGADTGQAATLTGAGVGIALLDTGVVGVPGMPAAQVVNGPDLSFESQAPALRYLDTYGHGTHMAGIMIANDTATGTLGLAPKAKLTSLKLGTATGAVDVSQVIAGIDWVRQHKNDDPANPIRVINLSYGSGGTPTLSNDPLQFAVEKAWKEGIVVVVSAGNAGNGAATLANPAMDGYVISVGASATNGTVSTADDELTTFSNLSANGRQPDLLAPGQSIVSLRDPGSKIDTGYPEARVGEALFKGSGTSQAAAVTTAAVALLLQARPTLSVDQVKNLLVQGTPLTRGSAATLKLRQLNLASALTLPASTNDITQFFKESSGTAPMDGARGTSRVTSGTKALSGENTIAGGFSSAKWTVATIRRNAWSGGLWMGVRLAGDGWTGTSFAAKTWAGATWTAKPWDGTTTWSDPNWAGRGWSGRGWSAGAWDSRFWAGDGWATTIWK